LEYRNTLPQHIVDSLTIYSFKLSLSRCLSWDQEDNKLGSLSNRQYDTFLTQIRLGLSPLRNQLFVYNIIDNPFCPSCGSELEAPLHFFFECTFHKDITIKLISDLKQIAKHALQNFSITLNIVNITEMLRLLVCGTNGLHSFTINTSLINCASLFIVKSDRLALAREERCAKHTM